MAARAEQCERPTFSPGVGDANSVYPGADGTITRVMAALPSSASRVPTASTSVSEAVAREPAEDAAVQRERLREYLERLPVEQAIQPIPVLRERLRAFADEWLD